MKGGGSRDNSAANIAKSNSADMYALKLLRQAVRYAAGQSDEQLSMKDFTRWLNRQGFKSPRGSGVSSANVKRSLSRVRTIKNPIPSGMNPPASQLSGLQKQVKDTLDRLGV